MHMNLIKTCILQIMLFSETATASCLFSKRERERERSKHNFDTAEQKEQKMTRASGSSEKKETTEMTEKVIK